MKKLIVSLLFLCFPAVLLAQNCDQEVSRAEIKHLILPNGSTIVKQAISADNREVIFLAVASQQSLALNEDSAVLFDDLPKFKKSEISIEKGKEILQEWEKMNNQHGFIIDNTSGVMYAKSQEYWIYSIKTKKWLKVDWERGEGLFDEWAAVNNKSLAKDRHSSQSPMGDKVFFEKKVGRKKRDLFGMAGVSTLYKLAVKCLNGKTEKLFFLLEWVYHSPDIYYEWAVDGSFVVISYGREKYLVSF